LPLSSWRNDAASPPNPKPALRSLLKVNSHSLLISYTISVTDIFAKLKPRSTESPKPRSLPTIPSQIPLKPQMMSSIPAKDPTNLDSPISRSCHWSSVAWSGRLLSLMDEKCYLASLIIPRSWETHYTCRRRLGTPNTQFYFESIPRVVKSHLRTTYFRATMDPSVHIALALQIEVANQNT
jgi:hypothetical protein